MVLEASARIAHTPNVLLSHWSNACSCQELVFTIRACAMEKDTTQFVVCCNPVATPGNAVLTFIEATNTEGNI